MLQGLAMTRCLGWTKNHNFEKIIKILNLINYDKIIENIDLVINFEVSIYFCLQIRIHLAELLSKIINFRFRYFLKYRFKF